MNTATPAAPGEEKKENPHVEAMQKHHGDIHRHLRAAHAAADSKAARMHITQAGMAATALHKTAKQAMGAEGKADNVSEYDSNANGNYAGES